MKNLSYAHTIQWWIQTFRWEGGGGAVSKKKILGPSDLSLVEKLGGRVPCDPPLDPPLLYRIAFHADTKS